MKIILKIEQSYKTTTLARCILIPVCHSGIISVTTELISIGLELQAYCMYSYDNSTLIK